MFAHTADYLPLMPIMVFMMWLVYAVPLFVVCGFAWFLGGKRVNWDRWDGMILVFPFASWLMAVTISGRGDKDVAYIWLFAVIAPLLRLVIGKRSNEKWISFIVLLFVCVLSAALVFIVP
jgi:hypothetical protein